MRLFIKDVRNYELCDFFIVTAGNLRFKNLDHKSNKNFALHWEKSDSSVIFPSMHLIHLSIIDYGKR